MGNRDDEYYDREDRRPSRNSRDDARRDNRRSDDRYRDDYYEDDYDDYDDRPVRRRSSEDSSRSSSGSRNSSRSSSGRSASHSSSRSSSSRSSSSRSSSSKSGRGNGGSRGGKKKKNQKLGIILVIAEVAVACILLFVAYQVFFKVDVTKVGKVNMNEEVISKSINDTVAENQEMKGYTNIALFGVDSREGELTKKTRTDTIIIASINNDNGDVKLCSVYRDTYLNLSNDEYTKCNAAYAEGGPEQAISMLNMNLDMDIEDFITIGFRGLTDVVDALGGVPIEVTDAEISHLNNYQATMAQELKMDYTPVQSAGLQTLNGLQATAYCRIRYTAGDDFKRAERQRTVLMACLDRAKGMSYSQLETVANKAFGETYTSLDLSEILDLLKNIANYEVVDNNGFPEETMRATGTIGKKGSCVVAVDLESNVKWLHQFLFEDSEYTVSEDVKKYSEKIKSDTSSYLN
ncbi:LCP family protein [Butyrivibrio sp. VCB2006]|uniref:LCP family protein n=1 Tax=Butyrivibrio sp. VCB2006 TaxID=1280679 RepID=UPI00041EC2FF|nr:LCP family protein [Butyrivibrio sp. VCB2006]